MVCGDEQPFRLDLGPQSPGTAPAWEKAGDRTGAAADRRREHPCAVLLPTGDVFVSGGVAVPDLHPDSSELVPEDAVLEGEICSPGRLRDLSLIEYVWLAHQEETLPDTAWLGDPGGNVGPRA